MKKPKHGTGGTTTPDTTVASVTASVSTIAGEPGQVVTFTLSARNAAGTALSGKTYSATSATPSAVRVDSVVGPVVTCTILQLTAGVAITGVCSALAAPAVTISSTWILATLQLTPSSLSLQVGASSNLTASARNQFGLVMPIPTLTGTTTASSVATVGTIADTTVPVNAIGVGAASIRVRVGTILSNAVAVSVAVVPVTLVASSFRVTPATLIPTAGTVDTITARALDQNGDPIAAEGLVVTWSDLQGPGGVFAFPTSTTDVNGVATVALLVASDDAINHQVRATSGALVGTSSVINVQAVGGPVDGPVPLTAALRYTRTGAGSGAVRVALYGFTLYDDASHDPNNFKILKGGVEQAILTPVLSGTYPSGRARTLYTEVILSGVTGDNTDLVAHFDLGSRTVAALTTRTYASWEDPTTRLLPLSHMQDPNQMGHAPAMLTPSSADFMCNSGAFGFLTTVADTLALGLGSEVETYNAQFVARMLNQHWTSADPTVACPTNITILNASFTPNLTSTANGSEDILDANWTGPRPPIYGPFREAAGYAGVFSTYGGQNYYGADKILFQWFLRTGNPEAFLKGCYYAETYRWRNKYFVHREGIGGGVNLGYIVGLDTTIAGWQMEGFGYSYLLTANPDMKAQLDTMCDYTDAQQGNISFPDLQVGAYNTGMGEPRQMERVGDSYVWSLLCAGSATVSSRVAKLIAHLGRVLSGTAFTHWLDVGTYPLEYRMWAAFNSGSPNTGSVINPGVNEFMQGLLRSHLCKAADLCGGWLTTEVLDLIALRVQQNVDRMYVYHFEGAPETVPQSGYTVQEPSFYNGWQGSLVFPDNYSLGIDLTCMFIDSYAWLAKQLNSVEYATLARRFFGYAVRGMVASGSLDRQKQTHEFFSSSQWFFPRIKAAPAAASSVASDAVTQITIQHRTANTLQTALAVDTGTTNTTLKAQARNLNRLPQSNAGLSAASSATGVATVTVDTTTGTLSIVGVGAGSATITVSRAGGITKTLAVTVATPTPPAGDQLFDDFSGSSLDATKWLDYSSGGSGGVTVSGGAASCHGDGNSTYGRFRTKDSLTVNLNTADHGAMALLKANAYGFFVVFDSVTNAGFAIFSAGGPTSTNLHAYSWREDFTGLGEISGGTTIALPCWLRIARVGGNVVFSYSLDSTNGIDGTWLTFHTQASALDLTAARVEFESGAPAFPVDKIRVN